MKKTERKSIAWLAVSLVVVMTMAAGCRGMMPAEEPEARTARYGQYGSIQIVRGNLKVGDGTPSGTLNGEDVYIEGYTEIDGELELDGALDLDSTANFADTVTFSKGSGNAIVVSSGGAIDANGNLDVDGTTNLDDVDIDLSASLNIDGHMVDIGTCTTPSTASGDNDLCVAGVAEIDGELELDGALDADSTANFAGAVTLSAGTGNALVLEGGGAISTEVEGDLLIGGFARVGDGTPDGSVSAGTDEELYVEGDFEVDGEAEFDGAIDADSTSDFADTATFSKGTGNAIVISRGGSISAPVESDLLWGGFMRVGDGTPDGSVADGTNEELYVEGDFEVDGEAEFDGVIDADSTANFADTVTFSKGTGNAIEISKGGSISTPVDSDLLWGGFVRIGDGTPDGSVTDGNNEELYIEGELEVDGEAEFDGVIDADSTADFADTVTFSKGSGIALIVGAGGTLEAKDAFVANSGVFTTSAQVTTDLTVGDDILFSAQTAIDVSQDSTITPTGTYQQLSATGGNCSTADIATGTAGQVLVLVNTGSNTILITDTGTLKLSGNITLGEFDSLVLLSDGTNWLELSTTDT